MLTWAFFCFIAVGIPYLILRTTGGIVRSVVAYVASIVVSIAVGFAAGIYLNAVLGVPPIQAHRVLGPAAWSGLLAPGLGMWLAAQSRRRSSQVSE